MNSKAQGDIGVAEGIVYYSHAGYTVSLPIGDNARYDLLADKDGVILRVQCKSTKYKAKGSRFYTVALRTNGGNKSGSSTAYISSDEVDRVFVFAFDGSRYDFPVEIAEGKAALSLGPSKAKYKV